MSEQPRRSIAELLADHSTINAAIDRAMKDALVRHARAGQRVAGWEGGRVVWVLAEEALSRLANAGDLKQSVSLVQGQPEDGLPGSTRSNGAEQAPEGAP